MLESTLDNKNQATFPNCFQDACLCQEIHTDCLSDTNSSYWKQCGPQNKEVLLLGKLIKKSDWTVSTGKLHSWRFGNICTNDHTLPQFNSLTLAILTHILCFEYLYSTAVLLLMLWTIAYILLRPSPVIRCWKRDSQVLKETIMIHFVCLEPLS